MMNRMLDTYVDSHDLQNFGKFSQNLFHLKQFTSKIYGPDWCFFCRFLCNFPGEKQFINPTTNPFISEKSNLHRGYCFVLKIVITNRIRNGIWKGILGKSRTLWLYSVFFKRSSDHEDDNLRQGWWWQQHVGYERSLHK